mgnify:CR=1 FL=1
MKTLIDQLYVTQQLEPGEFRALIAGRTPELAQYLFEKSRQVRMENYGNEIYMRGLIEFTNYCKNDCYYCGIRKSNAEIQRYRLTKKEILACCEAGHDLGFRTFVLQGGEDFYFSNEKMVGIIGSIKKQYPDCAITLSIGERSHESYQAFYNAGAERYLLRHETADPAHYQMLHPPSLTAANRKACLFDLKQIGFQVGCGFMVGAPFQTVDNLVEDLIFIKELQPHMVGIGPFIPHHATPFANEAGGSLELTLFMLGLLRLLLPGGLLPATTALGTIDPKGRELGILAGANVVMPNLSPVSVRNNYMLYDNKICTGDEAAECRFCMQNRMEGIGYQVVVSRGDHLSLQ